MEAVGALGRGPLAFVEAIRGAVRARSRAFWLVAGLTALAAALRFATLGLQAFHHDEVVTASRVLRKDFWHVLDAVGFSESTPPLYYAGAWAWVQVAGLSEAGLRSFSALAGAATVPVAYLLGAELAGRRSGVAAAALVAVNPMLVWYSQEARGYALLVLLSSLAALYFVRALRRGRRPDFAAWGVFSALALCTHYFAAFPLAFEAIWLLRRRGRPAMRGVWIVAGAALALVPLVLHQMSFDHAEWIGDRALAHRVWEAAASFAVGETGDVIAQPERIGPAIVPLLAIGAALLLLLRASASERRSARLALAIGAASIVPPLLIALLAPDLDFVLARNLIAALVPLLVAVGIAVTLPSARRAGYLVGAVLFAYSLGFTLLASALPELRRPDWREVAGALGEPRRPRALVTWTLGTASLRRYLSTGSIGIEPDDGYSWFVNEIDFISNGTVPPLPQRLLGPRFRPVGSSAVGRFGIRRYALPGGELAHLRLRKLRRAPLGFGSTGVLLDGIGPSRPG